MVTLLKPRKSRRHVATEVLAPQEADAPVDDHIDVKLAPDDPLLEYLQNEAGPVNLDRADFSSPGADALRATGVKIVVPLITQGELIGTLNLGPRLSEQEYSKDDLKLLDALASQAAPAVRVAQLIRQQEAEATERERLAQELRVARLIQHHFLPQELPKLPGWDVEVCYRPAREVGGDFYDFIELAGDRLGVVVADVTDKGVPAAMVMSATRTLLRATAQRLVDPAAVLAAVNEVMVETSPPNMFITCLYGVLDPAAGSFRFGNAGHNLPSVRRQGQVTEVRATGMPLGLMPGMTYDEQHTRLATGDVLLVYSDGIVEAHNAAGEMFGFARVSGSLERSRSAAAVVAALLADLEGFTGPEWEQEDDVTVVALHRIDPADSRRIGEIAEFSFPSIPGNERDAMDRVAAVVAELGIDGAKLERLKTAVAEAAMNAIEHGNRNDPALEVHIEVRATPDEIVVAIADYGPGEGVFADTHPDLEAKLQGDQTPRGWGLFLIRSLVDAVRARPKGGRNTIELIVHREGATSGQEAV